MKLNTQNLFNGIQFQLIYYTNFTYNRIKELELRLLVWLRAANIIQFLKCFQ